MPSTVYAVVKVGVYRHEIVGIYTSVVDSKARALEALCAEEDSHHTFDILEFPLNNPVEEGKLVRTYRRERVGAGQRRIRRDGTD